MRKARIRYLAAALLIVTRTTMGSGPALPGEPKDYGLRLSQGPMLADALSGGPLLPPQASETAAQPTPAPSFAPAFQLAPQFQKKKDVNDTYLWIVTALLIGAGVACIVYQIQNTSYTPSQL